MSYDMEMSHGWAGGWRRCGGVLEVTSYGGGVAAVVARPSTEAAPTEQEDPSPQSRPGLVTSNIPSLNKWQLPSSGHSQYRYTAT